ncbi:MAG: hypothetical protein HY847_09750 [Betaproteobacteria bacterium]|nr:hypothetical protein [Betaproteobacteria bacterium]
MNRQIHWDSPHELNAYRLLECNPSVTHFADQPCVIHYRLGDKDYHHFPDIFVRTSISEALWEIKILENAKEPEVVARTALMKEKLSEYGYEYCVVLGEDLAREPRLQNARWLLRYGRSPLSFEQLEYVRRLFTSKRSLIWQDVVNGFHKPFTMQQACRLVLDGILHLNLEEKFGPTTTLSKIPGSSLFGGHNG